jgi:DNA-binding CsgD family transcriptional regulator
LCRGLARLAGGDLDEGIRDLMAHGRFEDEQAGPDPAFCPWRSFVAPSLARAGRWQEARRLVEEEVTQARRQRIPHVLGIALEAAGLVIGGEQGIEHLQEALTWLDAPGSSYVRARTLLHLGSALRRANRRSECRATLVSALDLADRIGASGVARDARDELRIIGARPRRARSTGIESLSPSEYRVVRLACDGQTNRKIAQNLFVTVKTVEKQLASAFGKLGVESRVQLRALMGPESIAD